MPGRRSFIRIISYLTATAVCLAAAASDAAKARGDYGEALGRVRMSSLVSLCEYSSQLSAGLRALAVSPDGGTADPAAYVCSKALGARGSAASFSEDSAGNILYFLDGVYRFAEEFPDEPSEEKRATAIRLSDYAGELYDHLSDVSAAVLNGDISLLEGGDAEFIEDKLDFSNGSEDEIFPLIAVSVSPVGSAEAAVSREAARAAASELFGVEAALWRGGETEELGGIEVYRFTYGSMLVDISTSGEVAAFTVAEPCKTAETGADSAAASAAKFLKERNFPEMEEISRCEREFRTELEFAPCVGGVLHLDSAVKVAVCRCCSKLIRFDCSEYIKNYRETMAVDAKPRLARLLPSGFDLERQRLCVADIDGRARLCYLAECSFRNEKLRMYFDYFSLKALKSEPIS